MGCNVNVKMQNNLSVMHCAAQTYGGILSILFLHETYEMGINQKDSKAATPLHFAVL
jgi:hypothetical protein